MRVPSGPRALFFIKRPRQHIREVMCLCNCVPLVFANSSMMANLFLPKGKIANLGTFTYSINGMNLPRCARSHQIQMFSHKQ